MGKEGKSIVIRVQFGVLAPMYTVFNIDFNAFEYVS